MYRQWIWWPVVLAALLLVACQPVRPEAAPAAGAPATIVLASHDSFNASEEVIAAFEEAHNATLQVLALGDAGEALNKIILSRDAPLADVFFGVDNTFLSRALDADIFMPYESPLLAQIPDELELDEQHRLLPVDYGFVNLNADSEWFEAQGLPLPETLEDLLKPEYRGLLVAPNPASSSPGLAFLLTTIAYFGEDGYLDFWEGLRANDVLITDGWSEAYFEHFTVGSGGAGDRPLVVSYSTSPPADVVYATDGRTEPASVNISPEGGAFRQIEFVGILRSTQQPELAQALVDFLLDVPFQEDIPLQMFVYPANENAQLPDLFVQYAQIPSSPAQIDPAAIEANREQWIEAWTNVMLR
ncbi:MAG TPA: thiamine ABC transporter substrate-binding protein [Caldilineaceae bacterium]|nr:thiamine ABC transporter substrate-binding protein [Caldilineaceae bacterium]